MSVTYRCRVCNSTWDANREPTQCPKCGDRTVEPWGCSGTRIDEFYGLPRANVSSTGPVSTTAFTILYWLGYVGVCLGFVAAAIPGVVGEKAHPVAIVGSMLVLVSVPCVVAAVIMGFIKIYRGWKLIQPLRWVDREEATMPSPGEAVGFLFIPFFNLYWSFVAFYGLATRANKYMRRSGIDAKPMSEGLARAYCILVACSILPCFNILPIAANIVIYYLLILDVDRMRGAILDWQAGGPKVDLIDDL